MNVMYSKCSGAIDAAINGRGFGCFYSEKNDPNDNIHLHACCEILFCLSGGKSFFINDRIYEVQDGDVFVMNQFEAHRITPYDNIPFRRYVLQIHPEFLYENSTPETNIGYCFDMRGKNISNRLPMTPDEQQKLLHMFRKLSYDNEFGDDILKTGAALEIITNVNRCFIEKNKGYTYHSDFKNKTLAAAVEYINKNFSSHISLDIVAKNTFVSVNTLCSLFKTHMGTTVTKYITSKRMTEAKKLLQDGESVSMTAEKCGFSDYTTFIRAFRRSIGMSPGSYQKMLKK